MTNDKNNLILLTNNEIDELSNFIFSIGAHGHRDWPNNQKIISKIIANFHNCSSFEIYLLKNKSNILGYTLIEEEEKINRIIVSIGAKKIEYTKFLIDKMLKIYSKRKVYKSKNIHVPIHQKTSLNNIDLNYLKLRKVRKYLKMNTKIENTIISSSHKTLILKEIVKENEIQEFTNTKNRIFNTHWGFAPNTINDFNHEDFNFLLILNGNKIAGFLTLSILGEKDHMLGKISMIGIDEEFRKKGIGKLALENGISILKQKGVVEVILDVDSENRSAISIYKKFNFYKTGEIIWWEK
tara:strand:+ start:38134 stop:39021 length:888 start_codon:yes stop_codon:yes gene_type:complete